MKNITIIGSGSFGCALAYVFSKKNNIKIWSYTKEETDEINNNHKCLLLPTCKLDEKIVCYQDYESALKNSEIIILVTPSTAIRKTCQDIKKYYQNQDVVIASKGLEKDKLLSTVVFEELKVEASVISGPAHAEEIVKNLPTFVDFYGNKSLIDDLSIENFKLTYVDDSIGMQIGASLKNVIALANGICEARRYEKNTVSYLIVKGLAEIKKIGLAMGAKEETVYGLSGLGDLLTTAFSDNSRNKRAGVLLGRGYAPDAVKKEIGMVIEGFNTLINAKYMIDKYHLDCPLISNLYKIVYEERDTSEIINC